MNEGPFHFERPEVAEGPGQLGRAQLAVSLLTLVVVLAAVAVGVSYGIAGTVRAATGGAAVAVLQGVAMWAVLPVALALPIAALVRIRRGGRHAIRVALGLDAAAVVLLATLALSLRPMLQALAS